MNDTKINRLLRLYGPTRVKFKGVFGKNELKPVNIYPYALIINESTFGTRGTHWVAAYFTRNGHCEYFDSYGQSPLPEIDRFLPDKATGRGYARNAIQLQQFNSDVCGQ